jgi:hypothetical protein
VQIFDEGELLPIDPMIEALIRSLLALHGEIRQQQQGMIMLHFSQQDTHCTVWRKNTSAEVRRKVEYRGSRRQ